MENIVFNVCLHTQKNKIRLKRSRKKTFLKNNWKLCSKKKKKKLFIKKSNLHINYNGDTNSMPFNVM